MQKPIVLLPLLFGVFFAGCSDSPRHRGPDGGPMGGPPPIVLTAQDHFADGQLLVEARLSRGDRFGGSGPGGAGGHGRHRRGGEGAMRPPEGGDDERAPRIQMHDSPMPPVVLRLHLANQGTTLLNLVLVECNSALGNFGIRPERATLAPGETLDPESMRSLLGISGEDLPVTVTLKVNGKQEKRTLTLHLDPSQTPESPQK